MIKIPKISIIIPVYKVSSSIERCVHSLLSQNCEDIEYIFVNDSSPDDSMAILHRVLIEYPTRANAVRIIENEQNLGISYTRNIGLQNAMGEYIIQVDSDDWIEPTMVEELYAAAKEHDADVVYCDFFIDYESQPDKQIYREQKYVATPTDFINEILAGNLHGSTWNKLVKRELIRINNIQFPPNVTLCEDLYFNVLVLLHAKQINYLPKAFYHYYQNSTSISNLSNRNSFLSQFEVIRLLQEHIMCNVYKTSLDLYKARVKSAVFLSGLFSNKEFIQCYPDLNAIVIQCTSSKVNKIVIGLALKRHTTLARLLLKLYSFYLILIKLSRHICSSNY